MRKGFDLFLQIWRLVRSMRSDVHFCWVGGIDPDLKEWLAGEISNGRNRQRPFIWLDTGMM